MSREEGGGTHLPVLGDSQKCPSKKKFPPCREQKYFLYTKDVLGKHMKSVQWLPKFWTDHVEVSDKSVLEEDRKFDVRCAEYKEDACYEDQQNRRYHP